MAVGGCTPHSEEFSKIRPNAVHSGTTPSLQRGFLIAQADRKGRADCRSVVRYPDLSAPSHRRSRDSPQNRLISYRPDPANLLGLANTKKQMARFVLVHGGFSGAWIWLPLMDSLKEAGHLVEAFDLPGMGDDHTSASEVSLDMRLPLASSTCIPLLRCLLSSAKAEPDSLNGERYFASKMT